MATKQSHRRRGARSVKGELAHPHSVPIIDVEAPEVTSEQPFAEGAHDAIDADLRHRMISEAAYRRYAQRGYADGYDLDDWLQAEAEVDHLLLQRSVSGRPNGAL